jgi:predicted molibdopterin-dependent oxidoreductase YjgC
MSRRSTGLEAAAPEPFVEISEEDARQLDFIDGEMVAISSRRGNIEVKARVGNRVKSGVVFIPFHYHEAAANTLTNNALDPVCKIAETKVCAVRLQKLS